MMAFGSSNRLVTLNVHDCNMIDNTSPLYYHEPHGTQQGENEHDRGCMTTLIKTLPREKMYEMAIFRSYWHKVRGNWYHESLT